MTRISFISRVIQHIPEEYHAADFVWIRNCMIRNGNKLWERRNHRQQHWAKITYLQYRWMDVGQVLYEVDQFKYLGSTQTTDVISVMGVKIRPAQVYAAIDQSQGYLCFEETGVSVSLQRLNSISAWSYQYCSVDVRAGCWLYYIWRGKSNPLKTIATGCLANTRRTNIYVWQQMNVVIGRHEILLSFVMCHKLPQFSHVSRYDTLLKTILGNGRRLSSQRKTA